MQRGTVERNSAPPPPPTSETASRSEDAPEYFSEEEEEESLLHSQTAMATATRAEVHWDEASTDGEESEEGLEMTEGEDDMEQIALSIARSHGRGLYFARKIITWELSRRDHNKSLARAVRGSNAGPWASGPARLWTGRG